uniref:Uncharacterized protein n=1 Tax=Dikerogammarus haemobaphes virus 1 TaxID=2704946 RepID=A0A6G9HEC9_9VIRU|nr:hypothetical protein [Dikerogammarus haemobaphes virus 1]
METINLLTGGIVTNEHSILPCDILYVFIPGEVDMDRGQLIKYETRGGQLNHLMLFPKCKMNMESENGILYENSKGYREGGNDYLFKISLFEKKPTFFTKKL